MSKVLHLWRATFAHTRVAVTRVITVPGYTRCQAKNAGWVSLEAALQTFPELPRDNNWRMDDLHDLGVAPA